jgi:hypothetical protein
MNNYKKITVPSNVAAAIAHYVNLADTKTVALTDILSMGYEAEKSEIILRHFDGNQDELMEALICGYDVELTPGEQNVRDYYNELIGGCDKYAVECTLDFLGIKIRGVNA